MHLASRYACVFPGSSQTAKTLSLRIYPPSGGKGWTGKGHWQILRLPLSLSCSPIVLSRIGCDFQWFTSLLDRWINDETQQFTLGYNKVVRPSLHMPWLTAQGGLKKVLGSERTDLPSIHSPNLIPGKSVMFCRVKLDAGYRVEVKFFLCVDT